MMAPPRHIIQKLRSCLWFVVMAGCVTACSVPGMVTGTVSKTGLAALSAPGMSKSIDDAEIMLAVNSALLEMEEGLLLNVTVHSLAGRIMLTGTVPDPATKAKITTLCADRKNVRRVFDFLQTGAPRGRSQALSDLWIATKLKGLIVLDGDVSAVNFNISVHRGVVYIQGIAPRREEAERVVNHARDLNNVRKVELVFETVHEMALAFKVEEELQQKD